MVELACATTLVPAYEPDLFSRILASHGSSSSKTPERKTVVFIVCGGTKISLEEMSEYSKLTETDLKSKEREWEVRCNGEKWSIPK